jgi:hypothetical protein
MKRSPSVPMLWLSRLALSGGNMLFGFGTAALHSPERRLTESSCCEPATGTQRQRYRGRTVLNSARSQAQQGN